MRRKNRRQTVFFRAPAPDSVVPAASRSPQEETARKLRRLEAALLLARQPTNSRKLAQLADLADATEARTLIRHLNDRYDRNGRAMRVEQVAGGYVLLTRPQLAPWLRRLQYLPGIVQLTAPVLETLAIVAYRQPVMRADIEAVRGAACDEILRQLMQRDLVRISGRSEELGRPYLYSTTNRFLQMLGLHSIEALPHADWFLSSDPAMEPDSETENPDFPDSAEKESKVSVRLAAAIMDLDVVNDGAAGIPVAAGSPVVTFAPSAVEEDEDYEEEDGEEFEEEDEEYEDEEYEEEEDEEFEEDEEEFEDEEWEEVEEEDEEFEEDEEGDWEEEEYEEEDDEFEEDEEEDGEEEEEDEEWD